MGVSCFVSLRRRLRPCRASGIRWPALRRGSDAPPHWPLKLFALSSHLAHPQQTLQAVSGKALWVF